MIRLVDCPRREREFFDICRGKDCRSGAFGCRLAAVARAYGFSRDFARFWVGGGGAYGLLDGQMSLAGRPKDVEEARQFLRALGPDSVFCDRELAAGLGLESTLEGAVMAKPIPSGEPSAFPQPGLMEVCGLLVQAGMAVSAEAFYLDLSHRVRHGAALALGEYRGGELIGCAVVSAIFEGGAVLSALAVREDVRGRGVGTQLLGRVERALPGHRLYIFRESGKNRAFYERLGFMEAGRWSQRTTMKG